MGGIVKARHVSSLFVIVLSVLGIAPNVSAQAFHWGVKGGVNSSSFPDYCSRYAEELEDPAGFDITGLVCSSESSKVSPIFGGFVEIPVTKRVGVQAEVTYARKGLTTHFGVDGDTIDGTSTIDYVDIGALGVVTLHENGRTRFYVMGGPIFGVRVGQQGEVSIDGITITSDLFDEDSGLTFAEGEAAVAIFTASLSPLSSADLLRRTTVSLGLGAGVNVGRFLVEFRFSQGLTSALRDQQALVDLLNRVASPFADSPISIPDLDASDQAALARLGAAYDTAKMRSISVLAGIRF